MGKVGGGGGTRVEQQETYSMQRRLSYTFIEVLGPRDAFSSHYPSITSLPCIFFASLPIPPPTHLPTPPSCAICGPFYLSLPHPRHSISLILNFSLSLVQSISSELLICSVSQCCIFSLPPRTSLILLPSLALSFSILSLIESDAICLLRDHRDI